MKKQWPLILLAILLAINLVLTGLLIGGVLPKAKKADPVSARHVLYIGTTDQDTGTQLISTEEAIEIVNNICVQYVDGYTVSGGHGGWVNEKGELVQEESLVYTFIGAEDADVKQIMDEVLEALNQSVILCERQRVVSTYYTAQ